MAYKEKLSPEDSKQASGNIAGLAFILAVAAAGVGVLITWLFHHLF